MTAVFDPLPAGPFDIVLADPAWKYKGKKQFDFGGDVGLIRGEVKKYKTLPTKAIAKLPVASIAAPDALLFLWVTCPLLEDGMRVMSAWGFRYATVAFVWEKAAINPGFYTLSSCELCLVGKRGRIPSPRGSRKERQFITSLRGKHSAKPEEARLRIERMFPTQRKVELFARESLPTWSSWGNEITAASTAA